MQPGMEADVPPWIAVPERARAWARELANKALVYRLVRASGLGELLSYDDPWEELVAAVYRRGSHAALFRLERLGYELAVATWERSGPPRELFRGARAAAMPERSLLVVHGGMGLAFAQRVLAVLGRDSGDAELAAALGRVVDLCGDNSRDGCVGAALEAVGLYVRIFHPGFLAGAGRAMATLDEDTRAYFWHGVGRGVYFLPRHFVPGSVARALAVCRREAPDAAARRDALDGFFFATTMVNLRHPRVVEHLLATSGLLPEEEDVAAAGVMAALLARFHTTPDDRSVGGLLVHHPAPHRALLWDRLVADRGARAIAVYYPQLTASGRLGELARHVPYRGLASAFTRKDVPDPRTA
jgi:hypothetical protein